LIHENFILVFFFCGSSTRSSSSSHSSSSRTQSTHTTTTVVAVAVAVATDGKGKHIIETIVGGVEGGDVAVGVTIVIVIVNHVDITYR